MAEIEHLPTSIGITSGVSNVQFVPPQRDTDAMAKAQTLAELVQAELATLGLEIDLDQLMRESRGRRWSPWTPKFG